VSKLTDINDKNWVHIGEKLLTPEIKKKLQKKINSFDDVKNPFDDVKNPNHYKGKTLEVIDIHKDFFSYESVIDKLTMTIIEYAIRLRKKDNPINNATKIIKNAEMIITTVKDQEEPLILKNEVKE